MGVEFWLRGYAVNRMAVAAVATEPVSAGKNVWREYIVLKRESLNLHVETRRRITDNLNTKKKW